MFHFKNTKCIFQTLADLDAMFHLKYTEKTEHYLQHKEMLLKINTFVIKLANMVIILIIFIRSSPTHALCHLLVHKLPAGCGKTLIL